MSRNRWARKTDANQKDMAALLRGLTGVTFDLDHDDLLIGYQGKTYWIELKVESAVSKRTGKVLESAKKKSQKKLEREWTGHYAICWNIKQIKKEIGYVEEGE